MRQEQHSSIWDICRLRDVNELLAWRYGKGGRDELGVSLANFNVGGRGQDPVWNVQEVALDLTLQANVEDVLRRPRVHPDLCQAFHVYADGSDRSQETAGDGRRGFSRSRERR